jgi:hypothetical protein
VTGYRTVVTIKKYIIKVMAMIKQKMQPPGYGENNPEPAEFKNSATTDDADALHADLEYISGQNSASSKKPHMPCKNSLPT